jgi:hypothetical protein
MRWSAKLRMPGRIHSLRRFNFGVGRLKDNKAIASMFPEEMLRTANYTITPGTYLRGPTP